MKNKFTSLLMILFILGMVSAKAQENVITLPAIDPPDTFVDYEVDGIKYTNCKWVSAKSQVSMQKISKIAGSVEWIAPNGVGYVTSVAGKQSGIYLNGVYQGSVIKNESLDIYMEMQHGDQDTLLIVNEEDGTSALKQVIWSDFVDGTTVATAGAVAGASALNSKDNTVDVALSAMEFTLADEANGTSTFINKFSFLRKDVVDWQDFVRFLDAELVNTANSDVLPLYIHNNELFFADPVGYEIADGTSATFVLKIWIKSGLSTDLLTRMQMEKAEFTLTLGAIVCSPLGDFMKYNPDFAVETGSITLLTEASTVSLLKKDPFIMAGDESFISVGITDANAVVDSTYAATGKSTTLALSKVSGPGDITSAAGLSMLCKEDTAWVDFTDVVFSAAGTYEVQVEATGDYAATSTFSVEVEEATPLLEWTDFTQATTLPNISTPINADKEIIFVGAVRGISDPPAQALQVQELGDGDPVESFGFLVNTKGASGMTLVNRLTISGTRAADSLKIQYRVIDETNPVDWTDLSGEIKLNWDNFDPQFDGGIALPAALEDKDSVEIRYLNLSVNDLHGEPVRAQASVKAVQLGIYGTVAIDDVKPVLSAVTAGPVLIGADISATSNEAGMIYLVPDGTAADAAAIVAAAVISASATVDEAVTLATTGVTAGDYIVYVIDASMNVSDASAAITVEAPDTQAPVLSNVTAGPVTIGDDISATSNEAGMIYLVPGGTTGDAAAIAAAAVVSGAATADAAVTLSTTGLTAGDYIVYAVDEADNVSDASAAITVEEETGMSINNNRGLVVYPNPASDHLYIEGIALAKVQVFDITGKAVISKLINENTISIKHLDAGMYMINATGINGEQLTSRFIKR